MTDAPKRKSPRASLGSSEGDDIFGTFDVAIAQRFLGYLKPHRKTLFAAQAAVLISAGCQVLIPKLTGEAVKHAVGHQVAALDQTLVIFGLAAGAYALFFFIGEWLSSRMAQQVIFDIRQGHVLALPGCLA